MKTCSARDWPTSAGRYRIRPELVRCTRLVSVSVRALIRALSRSLINNVISFRCRNGCFSSYPKIRLLLHSPLLMIQPHHYATSLQVRLNLSHEGLVLSMVPLRRQRPKGFTSSAWPKIILKSSSGRRFQGRGSDSSYRYSGENRCDCHYMSIYCCLGWHGAEPRDRLFYQSCFLFYFTSDSLLLRAYSGCCLPSFDTALL